jgi:hypothetical protein
MLNLLLEKLNENKKLNFDKNSRKTQPKIKTHVVSEILNVNTKTCLYVGAGGENDK